MRLLHKWRTHLVQFLPLSLDWRHKDSNCVSGGQWEWEWGVLFVEILYLWVYLNLCHADGLRALVSPDLSVIATRQAGTFVVFNTPLLFVNASPADEQTWVAVIYLRVHVLIPQLDLRKLREVT